MYADGWSIPQGGKEGRLRTSLYKQFTICAGGITSNNAYLPFYSESSVYNS